MADYKDVLGELFGKVRDVADSTGVRGVYEQGLDRARNYGRIAKLSVGINAQSDELDKVYREIGKLYFDSCEGAGEGLFAPLFDQVKAIREAIQAKAEEINGIKASMEAEKTVRDEAAGVEEEISSFDDVVDATTEDGIQ